MTGGSLLIGAGKIGRGFLAHLAYRSGFALTFVDANPDLVRLLQQRRSYTIHVLGAPAKDEAIGGFEAFGPDAPSLPSAGQDADIIFVSVGGANLVAAGEILHRVVGLRTRPVNVIVGENWPNAAAELKAAAQLGPHVGIAEATILRSCIEPTSEQRAADPLSVQCQDYWELPVDADALVQPMPAIFGLKPTPNFEHALQRKVYTYNAINATIAYLGFHRGHVYLAEAANDPVVLEHARGVMREVNAAICHAFGYDVEDQRIYAEGALAKFQNRLIVDPIERQVRDPIRKLGRHDRLVGAAMLAVDAGINPSELALSIAAALQYRNSEDPAALRLQALVEELGPAETLARVAGLEPDGVLVEMVMRRYPEVGRLLTEGAAR